MSLKVAIVTNKLAHHQYFITEMNKHVDLRCVLHPTSSSKPKSARLMSRGWSWAGLKLLSKIHNKFSPQSLMKDFDRQGETFFSKARQAYSKMDKLIIHEVSTVNSPEAIAIIQSNDIDVICFLGGDITKKEFINSAKIACLNVHSGLSPFYNGNSSFAWVAHDGRPNFAGITLMHMNERIDGGSIIAHHLPAIHTNDTASSLFMKGIQGAVQLYTEAIGRLDSGGLFEGIAQSRSFKYTTGLDWTIYQDLKLSAFHKSGKMARYARESKSVFYTPADAQKEFPFSEVMSDILHKKTN